MAQQKTKETKKVKKKKWFKIFAPPLLGSALMGETPALSLKDIMGRTITTTLTSITRDPKQQNINVTVKVINSDEQGGHSALVVYELIPAAIKRIVRRSRDRIDDSLVCKTKDSMYYLVKPILITATNSSKAVQQALRASARKYLLRLVRTLQGEELLQQVISHQLQRDMRIQLSKVYPLRNCEVRYLEQIDEEEAHKRTPPKGAGEPEAAGEELPEKQDAQEPDGEEKESGQEEPGEEESGDAEEGVPEEAPDEEDEKEAEPAAAEGADEGAGSGEEADEAPEEEPVTEGEEGKGKEKKGEKQKKTPKKKASSKKEKDGKKEEE
ncbi:hypothetical protein COY95_02725 [Candidatus Woesearchaeota archaeon CG_4_10_14_0_8_um_filter_47_5]|nr:MAG: hypothetical protein COY95_02725 [Candidatus Woesearchaeota archaeon CG_4_10_14_0_8_um_filter_47_5]